MGKNRVTSDVRDLMSTLNNYTAGIAMALKKTPTTDYQVVHGMCFMVPPSEPWRPWNQDIDYDYGDWRLVRLSVSASQLLPRLTDWFEDRKLEWNGLYLQMPPIEHDRWEEIKIWAHQSPQYAVRLVPYAMRCFEPSVSRHNLVHPDEGAFVGHGLPFLPDWHAAVDVTLDGTLQHRDRSDFGLYILDPQPRIEQVTITPRGFHATVAGQSSEDVEFKMYVHDSGVHQEWSVASPGIISEKWKDIPQYVSWVLTQGDQLLDRKSYSGQNIHGTNYGVTNGWTDPDSMAEWIAGGEGQTVEFKRQLPQKGHEDEFLETVCAFANTNEGFIFIGVKDDKSIVGIDSTTNWTDRVLKIIQARITPTVQVSMESVDLHGDGTIVAVIRVPAGPLPPYAVKGDKPVFYLRQGDRDVPGQSEDIVRMAQAQVQVNASPFVHRQF